MVVALNQLQAGKAAAHESLVTHAASYTTLLREHIQKEDDILFRMADEVVPESDQKELLKRFEAHEAEEMGGVAHDRYLEIARDLEHS
jgi:hemerythrin-like domain-containing protein